MQTQQLDRLSMENKTKTVPWENEDFWKLQELYHYEKMIPSKANLIINFSVGFAIKWKPHLVKIPPTIHLWLSRDERPTAKLPQIFPIQIQIESRPKRKNKWRTIVMLLGRLSISIWMGIIGGSLAVGWSFLESQTKTVRLWFRQDVAPILLQITTRS